MNLLQPQGNRFLGSMNMNKKMYILVFALILLVSTLILVGNNLYLKQNNNLFTVVPSLSNIWTPSSVGNEEPTKDASSISTQSTLSLEYLVNTNNNCNLPCFWGIKPGITNWTDAMVLFQQLGVKGALGISPNNYEYFTIKVDIDEVSLLIDIYRKGDIVGAILLTIANKPPLTGFHPGIESYSLKKTFLNLGPPSDLLLKFDYPHEASVQESSYSFWVVYDDDGLQENYIGSFEASELSGVCPVQAFEQLVLYLYSPSLGFLPWGQNLSNDAEKLEILSSISAMDFFRLTTQSDMPVCIEIKQGN